MGKELLFLGCDPGDSSGGYGIVDANGDYVDAARAAGTKAYPMASIDVVTWLAPYADRLAFAVLEKVSAMPGQGVSSMFAFGKSFGKMEMLLAALLVPHKLVPPATWQRGMSCMTGGDKTVSAAEAKRLLPGAPVYNWNADALIMARYARKLYAKEHPHMASVGEEDG